MFKKLLLPGLLIISFNVLLAQTSDNSGKISFPLTSTEGLELINVKAEAVEHMGKDGLRITKSSDQVAAENRETLVIISDIIFKNGTIEIELAGQPAPDAPPQSRGFIGIAFRLNKSEINNYECIYLRPANGRADNQLQRNHSTQYISHPDYPWYRQRKESPGLYESYIDLVPAEWTSMKIVISGQKALLYVHDAKQPCLIVNDLKKGEKDGLIAIFERRWPVHFKARSPVYWRKILVIHWREMTGGHIAISQSAVDLLSQDTTAGL